MAQSSASPDHTSGDKPKFEKIAPDAPHSTPDRRATTRDSSGHLDLMGEMLAVLEGVVAVMPAMHHYANRMAALRYRYDEMRAK